MTAPVFVDTNVLLYAHDADAGAKREVARARLRELWEERTGCLSLQVLLSEDLQHNQLIAGVRIVNPFAAG
jgi:predicted nucleic acid-binding protein